MKSNPLYSFQSSTARKSNVVVFILHLIESGRLTPLKHDVAPDDHNEIKELNGIIEIE